MIVVGYFLIPRLFKSSEQVNNFIAVLPFINDSPEDSNKYFINGIMDDVLNNLQMVKELRVISRTSVEQYKNTTKSIPEIAKELGIRYILEGSGQKFGNKYDLRVQLIDAKNNKPLWSKYYNREISDAANIYNFQEEISLDIKNEIKGLITH
jgi:TolB-like protein